MVRPRRPCVFCGQTGKLTGEHVWGRWLRRVLPAQVNKHHVRARRIGPPGVADTWRCACGRAIRLTATSKSCAECNNGWLSRIQEQAKPYLIPLIRGERFALNPDGQRAVGTWCAMATMTGEYLDRDADAIGVSQADRDHLMQTGTAPPHWKIWIGRYIGYALPGPWQHYTVPIVEGQDVAGDDPAATPQHPGHDVPAGPVAHPIFPVRARRGRSPNDPAPSPAHSDSLRSGPARGCSAPHKYGRGSAVGPVERAQHSRPQRDRLVGEGGAVADGALGDSITQSGQRRLEGVRDWALA